MQLSKLIRLFELMDLLQKGKIEKLRDSGEYFEYVEFGLWRCEAYENL